MNDYEDLGPVINPDGTATDVTRAMFGYTGSCLHHEEPIRLDEHGWCPVCRGIALSGEVERDEDLLDASEEEEDDYDAFSFILTRPTGDIHERIRNLEAGIEYGDASLRELDELRADRNEAVYEAAKAFADRSWEGLCDEATGFSCGEAESIADLFRAVGYPESADLFIERHSFGDEPEDDHYLLQVTPRCDVCGGPESEDDWNPETGNHVTCEPIVTLDPEAALAVDEDGDLEPITRSDAERSPEYGSSDDDGMDLTCAECGVGTCTVCRFIHHLATCEYAS